MSPTTKHKALLLGEHETILGIATEPAVLDPEKPICLVLNAGIIHRIGAHRNAVNIARALAEAGFLVVRLDLSGIGDSPRRRDALDFGASAVADVREVMDHLSSLYATPRFVAIGLCSGADNAFQTAIVDDRLVGAVFLDGYAYPTNAFRLRDLARRARAQRDAATLVRKVAGNVVERAITLGQERLPQLFGAPSSESSPPTRNSYAPTAALAPTHAAMRIEVSTRKLAKLKASSFAGASQPGKLGAKDSAAAFCASAKSHKTIASPFMSSTSSRFRSGGNTRRTSRIA